MAPGDGRRLAARPRPPPPVRAGSRPGAARPRGPRAPADTRWRPTAARGRDPDSVAWPQNAKPTPCTVRRKRGCFGLSSRAARTSATTVASVDSETNVSGQSRSRMRSRATTLGRWSISSSSSSNALGPRRRSSLAAPELARPAIEDEIAEPHPHRSRPEEKPRTVRGLRDGSRPSCDWQGVSLMEHGQEASVGGVARASRSWPRSLRRDRPSSPPRSVPAPRRPDGREAAAIQQLSRLGQPDASDGLCGGEPCDAVIRGLLHFFDHSPEGLASKRALVRRLPHGDGPLPALAGQRRAAVPAPPVAASVRSACGRSALPADRRRRLPHQRRERQRLQQPARRTA